MVHKSRSRTDQAQVAVTLEHIEDLESVFAADRESLQLLVNHLREQKYHFSVGQWLTRLALPSIDKVAWRANSRVLLGKRDQSGFFIDADTLMHEGLHSIAVVKYGRRLRGRPRFTLLMEALASSLTLYLMLSKIRASGLTVETEEYLDYCKSKALELSQPYRQLFKRDSKAPYVAYRETALEMFEVHEYLLNRLAKGKVDSNYVNHFWSSKKRMFYLTSFDFGNQVLYAQANCGLTSTSEDRAICREIKKNLRASDSLVEFLRTFQKI